MLRSTPVGYWPDSVAAVRSSAIGSLTIALYIERPQMSAGTSPPKTCW